MEVLILRRRNMDYGFGFGRCRRYLRPARRIRGGYGPYGPMGRGYDWCYFDDVDQSSDYKELLEEKRNFLTERLEEIESELEDL